jgi:tRNA(Ile)-lysidine synthetase-like protein
MAAGALAPGWRLSMAEVAVEAWKEQADLAGSRWSVFVDADRLTGPLAFRSRQRGDRFQPLGLGGHTARLSDFFVNEKVPAGQRDDWPLLVCGAAIVWVVGLRLDERFRVTAQSRRVLRLAMESELDQER